MLLQTEIIWILKKHNIKNTCRSLYNNHAEKDYPTTEIIDYALLARTFDFFRALLTKTQPDQTLQVRNPSHNSPHDCVHRSRLNHPISFQLRLFFIIVSA